MLGRILKEIRGSCSEFPEMPAEVPLDGLHVS
jgi:hypothetical protein